MIANVPVGKGGRLEGVDESDIASGGGLIWVTVVVGALLQGQRDTSTLLLGSLTQE